MDIGLAEEYQSCYECGAPLDKLYVEGEEPQLCVVCARDMHDWQAQLDLE